MAGGNRHRARARRLVFAAAIAGSIVAAAPAGRASSGPESAWWWKVQAGPTAVPAAPPGVPADGLYVANDPTGPQAVAAVRAAAPTDAESVTLVLKTAGTSGSGAALVACATAGWTAATGPGLWADRPSAACSPTIKGSPSTDGTTWSFDLTPIATSSGFDVLIQPDGTGTFGVSFNHPDAASVQVTMPAGTVATEPVPQSADQTGTAPSASPSFVVPSGAAGPAGPTGAASSLAGPAAPITGTPSAALEGRQSAGVRLAPARARAALPGGGNRSPLALLAVALVAGAWLLRTRTAVAAAPSHPLAAPLALRGGLAPTSLTEEP